MTFGLSLGCFHKFCLNPNRNEIVTVCRENFSNDINAIEIVIPEKNLHNFKLSKINWEWLRSLKYVSLHLLDTKHSYHKVYRMIKETRLKINAFVCHVNNIPSFFLQEFGDRILFENMENNFDCICDQKNICFDVSHALFNGHDFFHVFFKSNEKKIKQIHLSNMINKECHRLFIDEPIIFNHINNFLNLKEQIVIVENACENLEELKKEVLFLKYKIKGTDDAI
jgi:hypothetical protein